MESGQGGGTVNGKKTLPASLYFHHGSRQHAFSGDTAGEVGVFSFALHTAGSVLCSFSTKKHNERIFIHLERAA